MTSHYFIAIHLPETIQDYFSEWQRELKQELPYKQWPHKKDLHITLKFLGPVADDQLTNLEEQLQDLQQCAAFSLATGQLGTFGNPVKPRVLWAGVEKTEPLIQLQKTVEDQCAAAGWKREKRNYRPHVTLAKKWNGTEINGLEQKINNKSLEKQVWHVKNIFLFRIHPQQTPKYEVVSNYPLQGGGGTGSTH
ncbi:RNA 2',3'-cyclic phosphodiesterase [Virgibacillus kimchii]